MEALPPRKTSLLLYKLLHEMLRLSNFLTTLTEALRALMEGDKTRILVLVAILYSERLL